MKDSRLVYSTESGRICPKCGQPAKFCNCRKKKQLKAAETVQDGIVRIRREVKGRKGKTVTTVCGLPQDGSLLKKIAKELKGQCGTGGSVKDGVIILQGDHRARLKSELSRQGYTVKIAGG